MNQIQEIEAHKTNLSSFSTNFHPHDTPITQSANQYPHQTHFNRHQDFDGKHNHGYKYNGSDSYSQNYLQMYSPFYSPSQYDLYDPFLAKRYNFINDKFPRAEFYKSDSSIAKAFPHLKDINDSKFSIESVGPQAKFFFMRSSNDDNIHKAIKYEKWTSTTPCNQKLEQAYAESLAAQPNEEPQIFLIYSVVKTRNLLGVAKMDSHFNAEDNFKYWLESDKYKGTFKVKWLFIKDVNFSKVEESQDTQFSIKNLKDGDEIPFEAGKFVLNVFAKHSPKPNIFDVFEYLDRREDVLRHVRDNGIIVQAPKRGHYGYGRKYGGFGGRSYYNNYNNGYNNNYSNYNTNNYNNGFKYNGGTDSRVNGSYTNGTHNGFSNGADNGAASTYTNGNGFNGARYNRTENGNGFRKNYSPTQQPTTTEETANQQPQDVAAVFFIRDPTKVSKQKKSKGASKKKPGQDKADEEFWNNKPKLTSQNIPESDDEEEQEQESNNQ